MMKFFFVLACLAVFSEVMAQGKFRKVHILGRPGENIAVRDRTIVPAAPVLEDIKQEEEKAVHIGTAPTVEEIKHTQPQIVNRNKKLEEEAALFKKQAEEAKYSFDSSIDDGINDHHHSRSEVRDGLNVAGMYSYSDGFFRRTVHYEADDKGYRIIKEEIEPVGDGPVINLDGEAYVKSSLGSEYKITVDDIQKLKQEIAEDV